MGSVVKMIPVCKCDSGLMFKLGGVNRASVQFWKDYTLSALLKFEKLET